MKRVTVLHVAAIVLAALTAAAAGAQGVRGSAATVGRVIEFRPLRADTIDPSRLETDPGGLVLLDGEPVACRPGFRASCIVRRIAKRPRRCHRMSG